MIKHLLAFIQGSGVEKAVEDALACPEIGIKLVNKEKHDDEHSAKVDPFLPAEAKSASKSDAYKRNT